MRTRHPRRRGTPIVGSTNPALRRRRRYAPWAAHPPWYGGRAGAMHSPEMGSGQAERQGRARLNPKTGPYSTIPASEARVSGAGRPGRSTPRWTTTECLPLLPAWCRRCWVKDLRRYSIRWCPLSACPHPSTTTGRGLNLPSAMIWSMTRSPIRPTCAPKATERSKRRLTTRNRLNRLSRCCRRGRGPTRWPEPHRRPG